jgi:hypothetical protein
MCSWCNLGSHEKGLILLRFPQDGKKVMTVLKSVTAVHKPSSHEEKQKCSSIATEGSFAIDVVLQLKLEAREFLSDFLHDRQVFSIFLAIPKSNQLVPNEARYRG